MTARCTNIESRLWTIQKSSSDSIDDTTGQLFRARQLSSAADNRRKLHLQKSVCIMSKARSEPVSNLHTRSCQRSCTKIIRKIIFVSLLIASSLFKIFNKTDKNFQKSQIQIFLNSTVVNFVLQDFARNNGFCAQQRGSFHNLTALSQINENFSNINGNFAKQSVYFTFNGFCIE